MEYYATLRREEWDLSGELRMPTSALLPMGGAVSGVAGPNWILIGDAAGCVNPLNGEGIDYGMETGRVGAELMKAQTDLQDAWPALLTHHYGEAFSIARRLAGLITVPRLLPDRRTDRHALTHADDLRPAGHGQLRHRRGPRLHRPPVALGRPPVRAPRRPPALHLLTTTKGPAEVGPFVSAEEVTPQAECPSC